jgi:hypothetical protein
MLAPLAASRGSHLLDLCLSGGKVHHQDPLCLVCGLTPRRRLRLNHGNGLLAGELASPWCYPLLGGEVSNVGLRLLPPMMSVMSLEREASFWLWHRRPWGNYHHGLSCQSILHPWCGCDESKRSPRATPSGRVEVEAPRTA